MKINNKDLKYKNKKYFYIHKCNKTRCINEYDITMLVNMLYKKYKTYNINLIDPDIESKFMKVFTKQNKKKTRLSGGK